MRSGKSKTTGPLIFTLNLSEKINLKKSDKYVSLSSFISINNNKKNIKKTYKNNKFIMLDPKWNDELISPDRLNSTENIHDYLNI